MHGGLNPNIPIFQPNCSEGLHFSAFHLLCDWVWSEGCGCVLMGGVRDFIPSLLHQVNSVYVIFDSPQTVSIIKIWNYAKTASRGVQDFSVSVYNSLLA